MTAADGVDSLLEQVNDALVVVSTAQPTKPPAYKQAAMAHVISCP